MFIFGNFLFATAQVLDYVLWAYLWILVARFVISLVNADYGNRIVRFVYAATEPLLERVRQRMPVFAGGWDLSPVIVWIAVIFLQRFLVRSLYELAYSIR